MKKKFLGIFIITLSVLIWNKNVYAKDTVYSWNKYKDERLIEIIDSYNEEGKKDGLITGGTYLDEKEEHYDVMLLKYSKSGKLKWSFTYQKSSDDSLYDIDYTYSEEGTIDGYLMVMSRPFDKEESQINTNTLFVKINLAGEQEWEKEGGIGEKEKITKITPIMTDTNTLDGYIAIGEKNDNQAFISKYDRDCNLVWKKDYQEENKIVRLKDFITLKKENQIIGYIVIKEETEETEEDKTSIIKLDVEGNEQASFSIDKFASYKLEKGNEGFIVYGITSEVKLEKGDYSYYLVKYNENLEEEWESIGNVPVEKEKELILLHQEKNNEIKDYTLYYTNSTDNSLELIRLDTEGLVIKKIKKIHNEYYDVENIKIDGNTIYIVGQINCPEDDNCDYDRNALLLISDEDKVIEVEDSDSKNIFGILGVITVLIIIGIVFRRKKNRN